LGPFPLRRAVHADEFEIKGMRSPPRKRAGNLGPKTWGQNPGL